MKISEALEPGYRKVTLSLLAVVGVVLLEKFGGGLTDETRNFILTVLGIFTGGNVLSKGIFAAKEVKMAKMELDQYVGPVDPEPQPPETQKEGPSIEDVVKKLAEVIGHINKLDNVAGQKLKEHEDAQKELSDRLDLQAKNIDTLINLVNKAQSGKQA